MASSPIGSALKTSAERPVPEDSVLTFEDSGAMRVSSSSSSTFEISAALRLRPFAAPLVVEADVALAFEAEVLALAAWGVDEEVVGVLKPFLIVLYCWLEGGVSRLDGR